MALAGGEGNGRLVHLIGFQEDVSLDERGRLRLPDRLVRMLGDEFGRLQEQGVALDQTSEDGRLSLYLAPGTRQRILVYPVPNIWLAIEGFQNPPPGRDPRAIRDARDYFYALMRFVETDRQNRIVLTDRLMGHAGLADADRQVTLVGHDHWLELTRTELAEQRIAEKLERFEQEADDVLDPAYPRRLPTGEAEPGL